MMMRRIRVLLSIGLASLLCFGLLACSFGFDLPPQDNPRVKGENATGIHAYGKELTAEDDSVPWDNYLRIEMSMIGFYSPYEQPPKNRVFVYPIDVGRQFLAPLDSDDGFETLKFHLSDIREETLEIGTGTRLAVYGEQGLGGEISEIGRKSFTVTVGSPLKLETPTLDTVVFYDISYVRGSLP